MHPDQGYRLVLFMSNSKLRKGVHLFQDYRSYSIYNFHFRQIQNNIDGNHNDNNRRINELAAKLKGLFKDSHDGLDALNKRLLAECNGLKTLIAKPLSVYFTAYRAEDYTEGGEAYLTFQGIHHFCFKLGSSRNLSNDFYS